MFDLFSQKNYIFIVNIFTEINEDKSIAEEKYITEIDKINAKAPKGLSFYYDTDRKKIYSNSLRILMLNVLLNKNFVEKSYKSMRIGIYKLKFLNLLYFLTFRGKKYQNKIEKYTKVKEILSGFKEEDEMAFDFNDIKHTLKDILLYAGVTTIVVNNNVEVEFINMIIEMQQNLAKDFSLSRVRTYFIDKNINVDIRVVEKHIETIKTKSLIDVLETEKKNQNFTNLNYFVFNNVYEKDDVAFFIIREVNGIEYYLRVVKIKDNSKEPIFKYIFGFKQEQFKQLKERLKSIKRHFI